MKRQYLDIVDAKGQEIHTILAKDSKEAQLIRRALYRVLKQKLKQRVKFKTRNVA